MSSPCRYAGDTIARSIALVMKLHGGAKLVSIRMSPLVPYGSKLTHSRQFRTKSASTKTQLPDSSAGAIRDRPDMIGRPANEARITKRSRSRKRLSLNDFVQTDRGKPAQCSEKHWSDHGRGQAAFPLQRRPTRAHGRDGDRCTGGRPRLPSIRSNYHCGL